MVGEAPQDVLQQLADCRTPLLIGVRHHSAALARVMPRLLDDFRPQSILLEMPPDFQSWLEFLGRDDLQAPVALAASGESHLLSFYPLADFSPELAAIRWAAANNVPVIACDLALSAMGEVDVADADKDSDEPTESEPLLQGLLDRFEADNTSELWERLVETPACSSSAEAIRRAALTFGWVIRHSSKGPSLSDAHREGAMRDAIEQAPQNSVAVVGSFHAAALLPEPVLWTPPEPLKPKQTKKGNPPATSLVPYSFVQLDQRSGYPSGVMDPVWHQTMLAARDASEASRLVTDMAVELCRELRRDGHVAGTPDATEIVRLARDLGNLRGHAAPGRGELLEAIQTALVQGDLFGRGRAVAAAAQTVLVGRQRGNLPDDVPRSGLAVQVEETLRRLKLPGPDTTNDDRRELRLDPLRSKLDRARAVVLRRLNLIGVQYAQRFDTEATGNRENLTEAWNVQWTHATSATLEAAGLHGVTLSQAAEATIRRWQPAGDDAADASHPASILTLLSAAAECGLATTVAAFLHKLHGPFLQTASAPELIEAAAIIQRIAAGHIAGLPLRHEEIAEPDVLLFRVPAELLNPRQLVEAALRGLEGLRGSDDTSDVVAMIDLTAMIHAATNDEPGQGNLGQLLPALQSRLQNTRREGSPRMQGAAVGGQAMLGDVDQLQLSSALSGWFDAASNVEGRKHLKARLNGLMVPLLPLVASDPDWLSGLEQRLSKVLDEEFLARLPALRGGFDSLTPADRAWLLHARLELISPGGNAVAGKRRIDDPVLLAQGIAADRAGRAAIAALLPDFALREATDANDIEPVLVSEPAGAICLADRWRLVLGVQGCQTQHSRQIASTLDQLYGASCRPGQGRQQDLLGGPGGGTGEASPSAREWNNDVEGLFGKDVCEEVMAEAAAGGRAAVLEHINPDSVNPSVELLEQVLSLRGALPERELSLMRKLARRITDRLAEQLANRVRPALSGLSTARPTRRRSRRLDFARTLDANLDMAYRREDGRVSIAPRQLIYRSPARRQMDWHLIFVVDVSGSMDASVIHSALLAAIFSSLPAIDVKFLAFSTGILDFSGTVDDPLSLLMEVEIGGGTHIGLGLRAAREAIKNPSRTLVVLVSDFEEGVSVPEMLSEVRMLADSGAKLIGLAALDDDARPRYHSGNAAAVASAGMSVAAVSPERLAQWVGDQIRGASK